MVLQSAVLGVHVHGLEGHVLRGRRVLRSASVSISDVDWSDAWDGGLRPLDQQLKRMRSLLRLSGGSRVCVVYDSPTAAVDLFNAPPGRDAALSMARLRLADLMSEKEASVTIDAERIRNGRDRGGIVIGAGEAEPTGEALRGWIERAGLRLDAMVPGRVASMRAIVAEMISSSGGDAVYMFAGPHDTSIGAGVNGGIGFVRQMSFGTSMLANAYCRALMTLGHDCEQQDGEELVRSVGIPEPASTFTFKGRKVEAREVLPMLQPVVQRYVIEAKQTMRFTVASSGRPFGRLTVVGPGSLVPNLVGAISKSLDGQVELREGQWEPTPALELARAGDQGIRLLPRSIRRGRSVARARAAIAAGTMVAAAGVGSDLALLRLQSRTLSERLERSAPEVALIESHRKACEDAVARAKALADAEAFTARTVGTHPDWYGALALLVELTGDSVRLEEIRATTTNGLGLIRVTGYALSARREQDGRGRLGSLISALDGSDVVESVELAGQRQARVRGMAAEQFELRLMIRSLDMFVEGGATPAVATATAETVGGEP